MSMAMRPVRTPYSVAASREVSDATARDHGLGRRAAHVDASSTDILALDKRGAPARLSERLTQRCPALSEPITIAL